MRLYNLSAMVVPGLCSSVMFTTSNQSIIPSGRKKLMIKSRSIPDVCCSMVQRYEKYFFMHHICTIFWLSMHQAPTEVFICAILKVISSLFGMMRIVKRCALSVLERIMNCLESELSFLRFFYLRSIKTQFSLLPLFFLRLYRDMKQCPCINAGEIGIL